MNTAKSTPRFAITGAQIDQVMAVFYAAIRRDPLYGPIFNGHINDWPEHEEKIGRFWRNAILREQCYDGRPMRAHKQAGNIKPEHFDGWLKLFDASLAKVLPPETAAQWSEMAHRMGRGLRMGVEDSSRPANAVPVLR